jgi:hypothetical protein
MMQNQTCAADAEAGGAGEEMSALPFSTKVVLLLPLVLPFPVSSRWPVIQANGFPKEGLFDGGGYAT